MIDWSVAWLMLATVGSTPASALPPVQFAQVVIREQIIVRVPARRRGPPSAPGPSVEWKEGKGPKCVPAKAIVGANLRSRNSVDLILRNSGRIRAELENSCPALDYYYGFYISPNADGQICADRDSIRSRMGGDCEIERFRTLIPKPKE